MIDAVATEARPERDGLVAYTKQRAARRQPGVRQFIDGTDQLNRR